MTGRPVVLTIAGTDSSGGAGATADLRTFAALGLRGTVAVTAVTAQDDRGVVAVAPVAPSVVAAQIESAFRSAPPAAAKTGMLGTSGVVAAVAGAISRLGIAPLVVDPVLAATSGRSLLTPGARERLVADLLPLCSVLTPNLGEAAALLGTRPISSRGAMEEAAAGLAELGPDAVLLKGGHLGGSTSPDLLWMGRSATWLEGPRLGSDDVHGTGCVLSAALAAHLALGYGLEESCVRAKHHVVRYIAGSSR